MAESRRKNSMRNLIYGIVNQVTIIITAFITRTIFIKILGAEYLGLDGLFTNILGALSIAELRI